VVSPTGFSAFLGNRTPLLGGQGCGTGRTTDLATAPTKRHGCGVLADWSGHGDELALGRLGNDTSGNLVVVWFHGWQPANR